MISHNLFLDKEDLELLAHGNPVETLGVSVPVWFFKGNTSEPAREVFCNYRLINTPENPPTSILAKGYQINIPQPPVARVRKPENWSELSKTEKAVWRANNPGQLCGDDLLDLDGSDTFHFKRYNKVTENGKRINIIHSVDIGTLEMLEKSFSF